MKKLMHKYAHKVDVMQVIAFLIYVIALFAACGFVGVLVGESIVLDLRG